MNKINLPWPPKQLSPNSRVHWAVKSKAAKNYRKNCFILSYAAKDKAVDYSQYDKLNLFVDFYATDKRHRDIDNCIASAKSGFDGIADALGVNDKIFVIHPFLRDETFKGGKVEIRICTNEH
jgi:crossover junction endodeoxyribonuclease RusA